MSSLIILDNKRQLLLMTCNSINEQTARVEDRSGWFIHRHIGDLQVRSDNNSFVVVVVVVFHLEIPDCAVLGFIVARTFNPDLDASGLELILRIEIFESSATYKDN